MFIMGIVDFICTCCSRNSNSTRITSIMHIVNYFSVPRGRGEQDKNFTRDSRALGTKYFNLLKRGSGVFLFHLHGY